MNACEGNANGEGAVPSVFQPSDAVAPQQGTGFTRLKDPSQMRMVLIVEAVACSGWEATFGVAQSESAGEGSDLDPTRSGRARSRLIRREASENPPGERTEAVSAWEAGPFSVKVKGSNHNLYTRSRKRGFRPEAAKQILGEGVRRSLRLPELVDHICGETGRTALRIGALEALWVQNERGGCRFLLAVHEGQAAVRQTIRVSIEHCGGAISFQSSRTPSPESSKPTADARRAASCFPARTPNTLPVFSQSSR